MARPSPWWGLGSSAVQLAALTVVLDFGAAEERAAYIGIASLAQVPFACAGPVLGGAVADRLGYGAVFVLSLLLGLAGAAFIRARVRDPRRPDVAAEVESPPAPDQSGGANGHAAR